MVAEGRPTIRVAFHDGQELSGGAVRQILVIDVGLTYQEARDLL